MHRSHLIGLSDLWACADGMEAVEWQGSFAVDADLNEDFGQEDNTWSGCGSRDALIFLVECNAELLQPGALAAAADKSGLQLALNCVKVMLQNKIMAGGGDLVGVVLAGVGSATRSDMPGVHILQTLEQPDAQRVLHLEERLTQSARVFEQEMRGFSGDCVLNDALWICQNMFAGVKGNLSTKRIFLFTNEASPYANSVHQRRQLHTKLQDLEENGCSLVLIQLDKPASTSKFDLNAFYLEALANGDEALLPHDPTSTIEELLERVRSREYQRRAMTHIPFELGEGFAFEVGVYSLLRRASIPTAVRLYKRTNELVMSNRKRYLKDTAELLLPQDFKKALAVAGKQALFEVDEVQQMRGMHPAGLRLLGFKPRSSLRQQHQIRAAHFIYPHEAGTKGSTVAFTALWSRCLARDVVALCRYNARQNTPPRLVALVPQAELRDEEVGAQVRPPGFHVIFLPFADDLRKLKLESSAVPPTTTVDVAKKLVQALKFKYDPECFYNPALQKHFVNVEAMALDRDAPEEVIDNTIIDVNVIHKKIGAIAEELCTLTGFSNVSDLDGSAVKRPRETKSTNLDNIDLESEARTGRLDKLTVPLLKQLLTKATKVPTKATRKADIIVAIEKHFGL